MLTFGRYGVLAGLVGFALSGCGGGGGGGSQSGITYATDWSGRAGAAITGASQRVSLLREDGSLVSQKVLNAGDQERQQVTLSAPKGTYRIRVELNSGADFGGTVTGVAEASTTGNATVETAVGPTLASLRIEPTSLSVAKGKTLRVAASALTANGRYAFVAPGSIAWSVEGAAATVSPDGTVTGVDFGDFKLQAKHAASGRSANVDASVIAQGAVRSKWTVLVFLSAANNLYPFAIPNVNQMERVASDDVRFVLQWKEIQLRYPNALFNGTRRYEVKPDNSDKLASTMVEDMGAGIDMGKPETLKEFIRWTKANYPADRYALVVWSHGNGWMRDALSRPVRATSYDDEFNSAIRVWELPAALQGERFDILSFDACLMQMLEVASEVKPFADYIAASAENTPGSGYPYDRVFKAFADNPDASTLSLAQSFVTGHVDNPPYRSQPVTQSVIDTSKLGPLEAAVDTLGAALLTNKASLMTAIPAIRAAAPKYGYRNDGRFYYDLVDIAQRLQANAEVPTDVKTAAQAVINANNAAIPFSDGTETNAFTHGLAIDFSSASNVKLSNYENLNLAKTTRWDDWLLAAP
ncbi:MAG: clostripain-related cysteine peptidase [Fimbriimonas sp.]